MGELIPKPWGHYVDHYRSLRCVFKVITVNPRQQLSLQSHNWRAEVWYCLSGRGQAAVGDRTSLLEQGSRVEIGFGIIHRLINTSDEPLIVSEMQCGLCDENDILRIEDDYGRKNCRAIPE